MRAFGRAATVHYSCHKICFLAALSLGLFFTACHKKFFFTLELSPSERCLLAQRRHALSSHNTIVSAANFYGTTQFDIVVLLRNGRIVVDQQTRMDPTLQGVLLLRRKITLCVSATLTFLAFSFASSLATKTVHKTSILELFCHCFCAHGSISSHYCLHINTASLWVNLELLFFFCAQTA